MWALNGLRERKRVCVLVLVCVRESMWNGYVMELNMLQAGELKPCYNADSFYSKKQAKNKRRHKSVAMFGEKNVLWIL